MGGLIVAAVVTIGFARNEAQPLVTVLAPYALAIVIAYLLQVYTDIEKWVTLREHLEAQLLSKGACMLQATVLDRRYRNRLSVRMSALTCAGLAGATFIASWIVSGRALPEPWLTTHRIALILPAILIGIASIELSLAGRQAERAIESGRT